MSSAEPVAAAAGGGAPAGGEEPVALAAHHTNSGGGGVTPAVRHPRVALVTGITGQDGSYLAELLLQKGYIVWGIIRRASNFNTARIEHIRHKLVLRYGDLSDAVGLQNILRNIKALDPERLEVYNLAAMSHVKVSFELPVYAGTVDGIGTLLMLEAIRITGLERVCRFYQASTSEMFGKVHETPQRETTPFHPRSPYGVAKLYAYWITRNYREAYGMFACSGILFNHESERRGATFVTRKITIGLGKILSGEENELVLGNLEALRDWGHAEDYVRGMWMMLQQDQPDDFVLATNETHSVREFVEKVFRMRGIALRWEGEGLGERGVDQESGRTLVRVSEQYFRPAEVDLLLGDATKARERMGWRPLVSFDELVCRMVMKDVPPHLTRQGVLHTADHTVVLVTGGTGLVGCGVRAVLDGVAIGGPLGVGDDSGCGDWYRRRTDEVWIFASSKDADLTDMESTRKLFAKHRPTHCLHLAARVGGLFRNMRQPLDFFVDNMHMNMNVLKACDEFGVTQCVSCLSTCIFPDKVTYPITEAVLHDGAPHASNAAYAHAKRMVDVLSRSYATQKPHRCFTTVVPTNVYGPSDNYHLEDAHVIPALIHKCHLAKQAGDTQFVVMGSGRPLRQFVHSHDLGRLMVWAVREYDDVAEPIIFSPAPAAEVSIGDVARAIKDAIGFEGELVFDATKADGQLRKTADNAKLRRLLHAGPRGRGGSGDDGGAAATKSPPNPLEFDFVNIRDGVRNAVDWLVANFETVRK